VKIGIATDVLSRLRNLQSGHATELKLMGVVDGGRAKEKELHDKFRKYRIRPKGEWYELSPEIRQYIDDANINCVLDGKKPCTIKDNKIAPVNSHELARVTNGPPKKRGPKKQQKDATVTTDTNNVPTIIPCETVSTNNSEAAVTPTETPVNNAETTVVTKTVVKKTKSSIDKSVVARNIAALKADGEAGDVTLDSISVSLPTEIIATVKDLCFERDMTKSQLIAEAISIAYMS
jgi:hypothetical protein